MNRILLSAALLAATMLNATDVKAEAAIKEGEWTATARAGIAPTVFNKSARMTRTNRDTTLNQTVTLPAGHNDITDATNNIIRRSYSAGFGKLHGLPFATGFDIGYAIQDNVELFFNFDWNTAGGKKKTVNVETFPATLNSIKTSSKYKQGSYNSLGFYVGGRYYFDMDSKFSPFLGAKLGLQHRSHGKHKLADTTTTTAGVTTTNYYPASFVKNSTGFSGGLQFGMDYKVTDQVSLNWMAEVIGSTSEKANTKANQAYRNATTGSTTFTKVTRSPKSNFSFPITAGVKIRM